MERKIFRELVSLEQAKDRLHRYFRPKPIGVEEVEVYTAVGRVAADDVIAPIDVPGFDRSAMDGFAVRASDTFGADDDNPIELKLIGRIHPGDAPVAEVRKGEAIEVGTGAPIPWGADAVLMVEYTKEENNTIKIFRPVKPGENILGAGSDVMAGEIVVRKGQVLTPREQGVLSSVGITKVSVFKQPTVAIISTGNELQQPGKPLGAYQIYDINSYEIAGAVIECGCKPIIKRIVRDNYNEIFRAVEEALKTSDVVITSGSTSAGAGDVMYQVLGKLGEPGVLVHGIAVKPGKPAIIAVAQGKPIFGLPGYPVSALAIFDIVLQPVLKAMAGLEAEKRQEIEAKAGMKIFSAKGRREFLPVTFQISKSGEIIAYPIPGGSSAIFSLSIADGFVEIPEYRDIIEEGEKVKAILFSPKIKPADLFLVGSHCVGLDIIFKLLRRDDPGLEIKSINVGSSGGFAAVRKQEADIAGTHLVDEKTGEYNIPFLEKFGVKDSAILVRGYIREQGLLVAPGNPKNIKSFEDLVRPGIRLINRNVGSGTRLLLDSNLKKIAGKKGVALEELTNNINGYNIQAKTHSAVAVAVKNGKADVGLAVRAVAVQNGLDFIFVANEMYDFLIPAVRFEKAAVQKFLNCLKSPELKAEFEEKLPGYRIIEETGKVIYAP